MANTNNTSLTPVGEDARVFSGFSHASLWFSLGVGLLVMQVGAYLVPAMGTRDAWLAIVIGSLVGSALLAVTAKLGCDSGLSSAGLMHRIYGSAFARLPVVLNIIQLIGWTTFELVVMRDGTAAIGERAFDAQLNILWPTLLWGGVLTLLMTGSMLTLVRQFVSRIGLPLVIGSLLWLSWHFIGMVSAQGWAAFMARPGDGSMSMLSAIDLVMAMPVSWLPLVADYARHGRSGRSTLTGTWVGYAIANAWCYALGFLVASVSEPGTDLVMALLLAQGGLLALGLILLDELDNAYGDVYSGAVCANSLKSTWSIRRWGLALAVLCTALAGVLPMHSLEPFLLMLSSVFVPLYGVILGRWTSVMRMSDDAPIPKVDLIAALLWLLGVATFHAATTWAPQYGSALPSLLLTFALARLTRAKV
ncbi:cytosine permease [Limnohabitans sp.]|uniref:purine-cytosine permease family protein n=1 Tax=Limnohabitans sp. TaxID=1907725 RepID=UPI00286F072D|nr:cytosine permease [Limnohabitans sp.]